MECLVVPVSVLMRRCSGKYRLGYRPLVAEDGVFSGETPVKVVVGREKKEFFVDPFVLEENPFRVLIETAMKGKTSEDDDRDVDFRDDDKRVIFVDVDEILFEHMLWLMHLQHFMLIIKPSISPNSQAIVFDFQRQDPEDIYVAVSALSGKTVPGVIRERKINSIPRSKCWYIGPSVKSNAVEAAYEFNSNWDTHLLIGHHDCRDYATGLAEFLTGRKIVLEDLKTIVDV